MPWKLFALPSCQRDAESATARNACLAGDGISTPEAALPGRESLGDGAPMVARRAGGAFPSSPLCLADDGPGKGGLPRTASPRAAPTSLPTLVLLPNPKPVLATLKSLTTLPEGEGGQSYVMARERVAAPVAVPATPDRRGGLPGVVVPRLRATEVNIRLFGVSGGPPDEEPGRGGRDGVTATGSEGSLARLGVAGGIDFRGSPSLLKGLDVLGGARELGDVAGADPDAGAPFPRRFEVTSLMVLRNPRDDRVRPVVFGASFWTSEGGPSGRS